MDIKNVRIKKDELRKTISELLNVFQRETGVLIDSIEINQMLGDLDTQPIPIVSINLRPL